MSELVGTSGRAVRACAFLLAGAGLLTLALSIGGRVLFPWPLEWMEGAGLEHAQRLLRGESLYARPDAAFIPYLYPPLSYLPMAGFIALLGSSLPAARLPSVLFTLGSLVVIGRAGARRSGDAAGGWLAAGMFAMGFGYTGAFLDLARVDACFVLLLLLGAERLQAGRTREALFWLALSVFAKQHGLMLLIAASFALLVQDTRRHALAVALSFGGVLAAYGALELATRGFFGRYTLQLPASQPVTWPLFFSFFAIDLVLYLPVLMLSAAFQARQRNHAFSPFDALLVAALLASALGRAHAGGHDNVRLPAFALLCIAGTAPLAKAMLDPLSSASKQLWSSALLLLQLAMLWQAPSVHRPPKSSAAAFATLTATLKRCAQSGRAVSLDYASLTNESFMHTMALSDLRMGHNLSLARDGTRALLSALTSPAAPEALAVGERFPALSRVLAQTYHECARVPAPRLASGYQPGMPVARGRVQVVYARGALDASTLR